MHFWPVGDCGWARRRTLWNYELGSRTAGDNGDFREHRESQEIFSPPAPAGAGVLARHHRPGVRKKRSPLAMLPLLLRSGTPEARRGLRARSSALANLR